MRSSARYASGALVLAAMVGLVALSFLPGCGGTGGSVWEYTGSPFVFVGSTTTETGPGNTGVTTGGQIGQSTRTPTDPCDEPLNRVFVTISMRNLSDDYIHYFFVAIAFVDVDETEDDAVIPAFDGTQFPDGAVCPDDVALYTQRGYVEIGSGQEREFGDYCITGPALLYFHRNGQFRSGGGAGLASAIGPAQGTVPTYDSFFTSAGAQIPVPDIILFHNPGTGEGGSLKISTPVIQPCGGNQATLNPDTPCERDSWYYVSADDIMAGSRELGLGSGRRVPNDIQGTGCECNPVSGPYQSLAPGGVTASGARCDEFLRGGRIEYAFIRQDETPTFPQLLWRVTDSFGTVANDFDSRAALPGG